MGILDWFRNRAQMQQSVALDFPEISTVAAADLQDEVDARAATAEDLVVSSDPVQRAAKSGTHTVKVDVDRINFAIDYIDSSGEFTRRPITISEISNGEIFPIVTAYCHLRQGVRTFRVDRIQSIITMNGEVFEPAVYFLNAFGIDLRAFARVDAEIANDPLAMAQQCRALLRPALALLVLAARSDRHFHIEELDVILIYAERELLRWEKQGRKGVTVALPMLDQLTIIVRNLRPDPEIVESYLRQIENWDDGARDRFWRALERVIHADGDVTDEEADFLDLVSGMQMK